VAGLALALALGLVVIADTATAGQTTQVSINGTFEAPPGTGSLAGWTGSAARLSLVTGGADGGYAARVSRTGGTSYGILRGTPAVRLTSAGTVYDATASARSTVRTVRVCLKLVERSASRVVIGSLAGCRLVGTNWVALPAVSYTTRATGGSLNIRVDQTGARAGDRFDVDVVTVTGTAPGDATAPTPPGNVTAAATGMFSIDVAWGPATDDIAVTGYRVYRDGAQVAAVGGGRQSFSDTDLGPGITHTYTVRALDAAGNLSDQSIAATATTDAATGSGPVIAAAGDVACDPASPSFNGGAGTATACRQRATADLLGTGGFDAILVLGDVQYECGGAAAFMQSFDLAWGPFKALIHPAIGNHEYLVSSGTGCDTAGTALGYFDYFGAAAGDPAQGYYSFDLGTWHIVALNSVCSKVACAAGSAQELWLAADLAAHPAQCTLAYWHHPRFSSGKQGNWASMDALWRDLQAAGAEVVLSGHDHTYERFAPQYGDQTPAADGIREFVVGTGGRSHGVWGTRQPNSVVADNQSFGILRMTLADGWYDWRFIAQAGGDFADAGAAPCH
jgi:acid phosphatase type 7